VLLSCDNSNFHQLLALSSSAEGRVIGELSLDALWESARSSGRSFQEAQVAALPEGARRYLLHAIAQGTELASAVRLRMHGEIKLRRWLPFTAQQVIDAAFR
jgi:hypothetical protein